MSIKQFLVILSVLGILFGFFLSLEKFSWGPGITLTSMILLIVVVMSTKEDSV